MDCDSFKIIYNLISSPRYLTSTDSQIIKFSIGRSASIGNLNYIKSRFPITSWCCCTKKGQS